MKHTAIEEVLLSLPDLPETTTMKKELIAAKSPKEKENVINAFLDEHGNKNFSQFLNNAPKR